jgi:hypothetical protein
MLFEGCMSLDSSAYIGMDYGLDSWHLIPSKEKVFVFSIRVQISSGANPASYSVANGSYFYVDKAARA